MDFEKTLKPGTLIKLDPWYLDDSVFFILTYVNNETIQVFDCKKGGTFLIASTEIMVL